MIEDKKTAEWVNKINSVSFSYRNNTRLVGQKTLTLGFQREFTKHTIGRPENENDGVTKRFPKRSG